MAKNTEKTGNARKTGKPLRPSAARREIAALERMLDDGDITLPEFWRMKTEVLKKLGAGNE